MISVSYHIYLVKFDRGYYAKKQPVYEWSFTDDPLLAYRWKKKKDAEARGEWGVSLSGEKSRCASFTVEKYLITETMEQIIGDS